MTRRGLTLIEVLLGIVVVWLVVWLTSYLATALEIPLFVSSAMVVCGYVILASVIGLTMRLGKADSNENDESSDQ